MSQSLSQAPFFKVNSLLTLAPITSYMWGFLSLSLLHRPLLEHRPVCIMSAVCVWLVALTKQTPSPGLEGMREVSQIVSVGA